MSSYFWIKYAHTERALDSVYTEAAFWAWLDSVLGVACVLAWMGTAHAFLRAPRLKGLPAILRVETPALNKVKPFPFANAFNFIWKLFDVRNRTTVVSHYVCCQNPCFVAQVKSLYC